VDKTVREKLAGPGNINGGIKMIIDGVTGATGMTTTTIPTTATINTRRKSVPRNP
jgi:hypothetical protein